MSPLQRIGVERNEGSLFTWAGLCLLAIGAGSAALQNSAETLFLKRVGVETLPLAFLGSSLALAFATHFVGQAATRIDRPRWQPLILLGLAASLIPVWVMIYAEVTGILAALLVLVKLLDGIALLVFWITLGDLITGRQAKRLFAPLAAGSTLGRLIGSFATAPASKLVGIEGLVLLAAALYALAALSALLLRRTRERGSSDASGSRGASARAFGLDRRTSVREPGVRRIWQESRLFRFLVIWSFCVGALGPMLYFQFSYSVDAATRGANGEQAMLDLYAQFRGWLNLAVLVMQLAVSGKLYRRFGLPISAAVWPVTYLGGFFWMGLTLSLPAAMTTTAAVRLEGDAVAKPALKILHNLLPNHLRSQATGYTEGPVKAIGGACGNAVVLAAIAFGGPSIVSIPAVPLAGLWALCAVGLWRHYPQLLLQASSDRSLSSAASDLENLLDPATIRALAANLLDPDPDVARAAAELIGEADPATAAGALADALENTPPESLPMLMQALQLALESCPPGEVRNARASAAVAKLLEDPEALPAESRADLLQVYARLTSGESSERPDPVLDGALGDAEAAIRLGAITELCRRGTPPPGVRDLDTAIADAFESDDVLLRRAARKELRANLLSSEPDALWKERLDRLASGLLRRVDRAEVAASLVEVARRHGGASARCLDAVLAWADDPDPRVRACVLEFIGLCGAEQYSGRLVIALAAEDETISHAAQEGLLDLGPAVTDELICAFRSSGITLRDNVIQTMCRLDVPPEIFMQLYEAELHATLENALRLGALVAQGCDERHLLVRHLEERVDEGLGAALCLLAAVDGAERILELESQIRTTPDAHKLAILVEAMESLLPPAERARLVPLFEADGPEERGRIATQQLGVEPPSRDRCWEELAEDGDPLTRQLRAALPAPWLEPQAGIADTPGVPMQTVQIAAHLQRSPGFNRLLTRQLMRVAEKVKQLTFQEGTLLYEEGDEFAALYVLVDGEVSLSMQGTEVGRVGADSLVGVLWSIDGGPSTEQARAESDVVALRIQRDILIDLMSEAPAFSIGMSRVLADRVRFLHSRLAPGTAEAES